MINVAILGYGTVGAGVYRVLNMNRETIARRTGEEIYVKYVLDLREFPGDPAQEVLTHDYNDILSDPEVKIVVETMGGLRPAYMFTKQALEAGKSVCTSNKELVAEHGLELRDVAKANNVNYLFEASCGGGIPIIHALDNALTADEIDAMTGILNGTTNYILTQMAVENEDFAEALKGAQKNGYAELHPEADIEGWDACRKIAILSSLAYGKYISYKNVYTEGITNIDTLDIAYAKALGLKIKLLAASKRTERGTWAMVAPRLLDKSNMLYHVEGVELLPIDEVRNTFFVRFSGSEEEAEAAFSTIDAVRIPEAEGEFGFFTAELSEKEFREMADKSGKVIKAIRRA